MATLRISIIAGYFCNGAPVINEGPLYIIVCFLFRFVAISPILTKALGLKVQNFSIAIILNSKQLFSRSIQASFPSFEKVFEMRFIIIVNVNLRILFEQWSLEWCYNSHLLLEYGLVLPSLASIPNLLCFWKYH